MFAIKPIVYSNDPRLYHRRRKFHTIYDRVNYRQNIRPIYDLRLIVLRHGERIDLTLGDTWYDQVFGGLPSAEPLNYRHPYLPQRLPYRELSLMYVFDPPITRIGEQKAMHFGQQLSQYAANIDSCYSSPASRCILTANGVLRGMNRGDIPMRLEPYLFEPMNWNKPLQDVLPMSPFLSKGDWIKTGYNVDRRYHRISEYLDPLETEVDYWNRTQAVFQSIERHHDQSARNNGHRRHSNILIVGHAATPLVFSNIALRQPFDPVSFGQQCANVQFLQTVVLEREATTRIWNVRPISPIV